MRTVLIAAVVALPLAAFAAREGQVVAVQELRSRLAGNEAGDPAALAERIRDVARRTLPEARVLARDEQAAADLVVSGAILRLEQGFLVSLEMRDPASDKLLGAVSAAGDTPEELSEAVEGAAVDLFRPQKSASASATVIGPAALPEIPTAPPQLPEGGALNLDVDANVLVAYDEARGAETQGKDHPEDAAAAWRAVAEEGGENPFREMASARAREWQSYTEQKRAFDAQLAKDTGRLRKVLPLRSIVDGVKVELLARYARAYGVDRATPLMSLLPASLRPAAATALGCEAKDAGKCIAMARSADEAKDPKSALEYLDRACAAGAAPACAEAGDRWLSPDTREVARAIPVLQRGCAAGNGASCARLARVYEEGDGAAADHAQALDLRDKACSARDGASCRRLASTLDGDPARARELWRKGCEAGDAVSCAVAKTDRPQLQRQVAEAAGVPTGGVKPASAVSGADAKPPAPADATSSVKDGKSARNAGYALIGFGAVAAAGAAFLAMPGPDFDVHRSGRRFVYAAAARAGHDNTLKLGLAAGAVLAAGTGLAILFTQSSDPQKPKVALDVAPGAVGLSGTLP